MSLMHVVNACGSGNLLPHNITGYIDRLEKIGAEVIFILTDLDEDICITQTKNRIAARQQGIMIIAVKKIEAWFLANNNAMRSLLNDPEFTFLALEVELNPFEKINDLLVQKTGRGVGRRSAGKIKLLKRLLDVGFQINDSASYPNCPSAKYFIDRLTQIGSTSATKKD